jgi:type II secretory pathway pseudopilin PulG
MRKKIQTPRFEIRNATGFTYVALLAAIVILGISMGAAGKYWSFVMQREKEEELLFRGEQYRLAIERYYRALPGRNVYPPSIEELLKDSRTPTGKRHLRQAYKDPITGEDFEVIRDQTKGNRITGIFSTSEKEPVKKAGFPEQYPDFENKMAYKEWKFVYTMTTTGQAGTLRGVTPPTSAK